MRNGPAIILTAFFIAFLAWPVPSRALTIGGAVRQPLNLSVEDLARYDSVEVRLNDLTRDKKFGGAFHYRGTPLRYLLDIATVAKDGPGFPKSSDMAIVVRNREGKRTVLSWGEVFYRNPSNVVIAYAARPITPHHQSSCIKCHAKSFYQPVLDRLKRTIPYPKLVLSDDFYSDRCLEDIVSIEVVDIRSNSAKKKSGAAALNAFNVRDASGKSRHFSSLSGYTKVPVTFKEVGDGRGWHGIRDYTGTPLREILRKADDLHEMDRMVLFTSKDGYRSAFSFGEIFLNPLGERLVIAESKGTARGETNYTLVTPDDQAADRMIKTIETIEILSLKEEPKLYIVSVGCADPNLMTLEAISTMGKVDAFIAAEGITKKFARYMDGKPVLFDPMRNFEPIFRKNNPGLAPAEIKRKLEAQRAADMKKIRDTLAAGKSIALLEHGDPTIFGGWQHWIEPEVNGRFEVVTGISAFNAANALFANRKVFTGISAFGTGDNNNLVCNHGNAIISAPQSLADNEKVLHAIAESGDTLAIFMGLKEIESLLPLLKKYYPETTPAAIAYKAGYAQESHLVKTTIGELRKAVEANKERIMGMIYVGNCLGGK
ncbi:MAG TPA: SAM-dependent methyltransferase [Geobacteraceae bacterium]|nr:SAM-dependent methyltransferase [Geobacteraceae bacterium]